MKYCDGNESDRGWQGRGIIKNVGLPVEAVTRRSQMCKQLSRVREEQSKGPVAEMGMECSGKKKKGAHRVK